MGATDRREADFASKFKYLTPPHAQTSPSRLLVMSPEPALRSAGSGSCLPVRSNAIMAHSHLARGPFRKMIPKVLRCLERRRDTARHRTDLVPATRKIIKYGQEGCGALRKRPPQSRGSRRLCPLLRHRPHGNLQAGQPVAESLRGPDSTPRRGQRAACFEPHSIFSLPHDMLFGVMQVG